MYNTKLFAEFQPAQNASIADMDFLNSLEQFRDATSAKFVTLMTFDYALEIPNQSNYLTYPISWFTNYLAKGYNATDPFLLTDFRKKETWDWRDLRWDGAALRQLDDFELYGLGRNGILIPRYIEANRYIVLALNYDTFDDEWAIQKLWNINCYLRESKKIVERFRQIYHGAGNQVFSITERETECLRWVALGKTDNQIAEQMGVAKWTVVGHLRNAKRKLDTPNRASAVAVALTTGIISI